MSYEVWGDDDDGLDSVREQYRETLLADGWLDDVQAVALQTALAAQVALENGRAVEIGIVVGVVLVVNIIAVLPVAIPGEPARATGAG